MFFFLSNSMDKHTSWTRWSWKNSNSTSIRFDTSNLERLRRLFTRCWSCIEVITRQLIWKFGFFIEKLCV